MEPLCKKYNCFDMVVDEYRKRARQPKAISLHRYKPKDIYCSTLDSYGYVIDIYKYDFAKNEWNEFKSIRLDGERYFFGSIFMNGELFVMGGQNEDFFYLDNVSAWGNG